MSCRRQSIIWTNDGILLIEHSGMNFNGISIETQTFTFKGMHWKMLSGKWHLICLGLNVLTRVSKVALASSLLGLHNRRQYCSKHCLRIRCRRLRSILTRSYDMSYHMASWDRGIILTFSAGSDGPFFKSISAESTCKWCIRFQIPRLCAIQLCLKYESIVKEDQFVV